MNAQLRLQQLMRAELIAIQARNPAYSLRAFAKRLGLPVSAASEILSGQRRVTRKMAVRILDGLGTAPADAQEVIASLEVRARRASAHRKRPGPVLASTQIDMDEFQVVSDWQYFAILSLADTRDFEDSPAWVAKRLGIRPQDARVAMERLERLEMLTRKKGELRATGKQFTTTTDITHLPLRKHHYQNLELARRSLDRDAVLEREFTFINMAIDPDDLPEMKRRIREFRDELCVQFEARERKEVYKMCIQLFPLTQGDNNESV